MLWTHQPDPEVLRFRRRELGGGLRQKVEAEMGRFVQIAMGSGTELSYHLRLARDLGLISKPSFDRLRSDLSEVMRMLSTLSQKLRPRVDVVQLRAKS